MLGGDEIPTTFRVPTRPRVPKHDLLSPEVLGIEIPGEVFTPVDVQRHTIEDFKEAFGDLMTTDVPISALIGAKQVGDAAGELTHAIRTLMDGVQLLGPGVLGQVVPDGAEAERARTALSTITSMIRDAAWRSDTVRAGAQKAVQGALPALKEAKKDHDFKAAAHSLIDVVGGVGGELQKPEVQQLATAASAVFIESAASALGSDAVQNGDTSPTEALAGAAAMSKAALAGVFGAKLQDPSVAGDLKEAAAVLKRFGGPLVSLPEAQDGRDELLRNLGRMLQDPGKREALNGAVATLIKTTGTVGGSLQNGNRNKALKNGAGFIIEAVGNKLQTNGAVTGAATGAATV